NSSRGSILINGSPTEEFNFFKGLKQGDHLSPFLFILIMESLHLSFQRVVDAGMFKGIKLNSSTTLSHMFYVDDAIFVGKWCDDNINTLIHVLECFYRASGLRINMTKSKIMGVLVAENKIKSVASKLGCLLLKTPFTYLGTKVGGSMSKSRAWEDVINKERIIKAIHGVDEKIGKNTSICNNSCWLNIVKEISVLKNDGINVMEFMKLKLGNGNNISFWEDHWIGGSSLKTLFPRLYALKNIKHASVNTKLVDISIDSSCRRKPRGGAEHAQFVDLSNMISNVILLPSTDKWYWSLEGSEEFTVSSIRKKIDDKRSPGVSSKARWIKSVPNKVNILAWKVKLDALPTKLNISHR
nr:RNA-directed DNA polymerase, eukaryota, reverse transcriptase zinc-binding domain protein [Tanacetum cinerariifolium]